jgi:hypothetical protein
VSAPAPDLVRCVSLAAVLPVCVRLAHRLGADAAEAQAASLDERATEIGGALADDYAALADVLRYVAQDTRAGGFGIAAAWDRINAERASGGVVRAA